MEFVALAPQDERLRTACAEVSLVNLRSKQTQNEIDELLAFALGRRPAELHMLNQLQPSTVGLSANQVGLMKQICVLDFGIGHRGQHDWRVLINPKITWRSQQMINRVEGCVNFPEVWGITSRPRRVKVSALDRWGNHMQLDVGGWAATLLEHEADHLSGHLFVDRLVDPEHAHIVSDSDYPSYRKTGSVAWPKTLDVRHLVRKP